MSRAMWNGVWMSEVVERCSCGAKFSLTDVAVDLALKATKDWRRNHFCQVPEQANEVNIISSDTSRNEVPFGFTRGLTVMPSEIDTGEDDE